MNEISVNNYHRNMITRSYIYLSLYFTVFVRIRGIIFISIYENETSVFDQAEQVNEIKNTSYDMAESNSRMFGIDTGNADTDHEAGMWLMALLGTLAAAVPVAFLSPNLGFKKRSADEPLPFGVIIENTNQTKGIYTKAEERFYLAHYQN